LENLANLTTESRSEYMELDRMSAGEILQIINREDTLVPIAVGRELPKITAAVEMIVERLSRGGHLFYVGAGTSGRLGVLDASECPPTFGVSATLVQGVIAGGDRALRVSTEGAEDNADLGVRDLQERDCGPNDVVVAIAASGRTPYCIGALKYARQVGAGSICLVCNPGSPMAQAADITIAPVVGPEVLIGSTRMKAGTAQKLVLNMISTTTMVRLGKVYSNLMVDVAPANVKLVDRAKRIIQLATGADSAAADQVFTVCNGNVKQAIVAYLTGCTPTESEALLGRSGGFVRRAIEAYQHDQANG
jgi:N-acetylmuramic acid 6-phosphate etherase